MKKPAKPKRGGGRKPLPQGEKLETVWILVKGNDIQRVGGQKALKEICYNAIKAASAVAEV